MALSVPRVPLTRFLDDGILRLDNNPSELEFPRRFVEGGEEAHLNRREARTPPSASS